MATNITRDNRLASLDIIRAIALILVLLIHGVEIVFRVDVSGMADQSIINRIAILVVFCLGRLSVPLFLFLTGYLMLNRKYEKEDIIPFYKKRVSRLFLVTVVWTIVYWAINVVRTGNWNVDVLLKSVLFLDNGNIAPHLWYMPVITVSYLLIPFIACILKKYSLRQIGMVLFVSFVYYFVAPVINTIMLAHSSEGINNAVGASGPNMVYMPVVGCLYMIVGYYLRMYVNKLKSVSAWIFLATGIAFFLAVVILQYLCLSVWHYNTACWYDSIFILLASACLFAFLINITKHTKSNIHLSHISQSVLGLYLIHYIFLYMFTDHIRPHLNLNLWLEFAVAIAFTVAGSVVSILVLNRSRRLSSALGLSA